MQRDIELVEMGIYLFAVQSVNAPVFKKPR